MVESTTGSGESASDGTVHRPDRGHLDGAATDDFDPAAPTQENPATEVGPFDPDGDGTVSSDAPSAIIAAGDDPHAVAFGDRSQEREAGDDRAPGPERTSRPTGETAGIVSSAVAATPDRASAPTGEVTVGSSDRVRAPAPRRPEPTDFSSIGIRNTAPSRSDRDPSMQEVVAATDPTKVRARSRRAGDEPESADRSMPAFERGGPEGGHSDQDPSGAGHAETEPPLTIQQDVIIGLDVSGTTFDAGVVTTRGDLISRSTRPIEPDVGPQSHFAAVVQVITEQLDAARDAQCRVRAIGIASPGPITPNCEQVSPLSIPAWRDFPLRRHLIELAQLPVYGDLDAKALALSEGWLGVARGRSSFATIMVSASIGGGLVIDGDLLDGANGNAGHIGHVIVEPGGRRCRCGARGCLDAEASGLAIETITGRPTTEPSYDIMRQTGTLVGRAAAIVCNSLDLNFVVVGGDVAEGFAATFMNAAQQEADRVGSAGLGTTPHVAAARLGSRGVLIGAGAVGIRGIRRHRARRDATT